MNFYTTKEAAHILKLTKERVAVMCRTGQLRARNVGGLWLIDPQDLAEFSLLERKAGRPRTKRAPVEGATA